MKKIIIVPSKEIPVEKNRGYWIAYSSGTRNLITSSDSPNKLTKKIVKMGYHLDQVSISFNNKNDAVCLF